MNRANRMLPFILALQLMGCYAQVEDGSVSLTEPLCPTSTTNCIPGAGQPLSVVKANGTDTVTVPLGDQELFKPETNLGPTKLVAKMILNKVTLDLRTAGADFKGITKMTIVVAPRPATGPTDHPCDPPATCPVLASYTAAAQGIADQQLSMKGEGADIIKYIDQVKHQLVIEVRGQGTSPGSATVPLWNADLTVDMALNARVNFP